MSRTPKTIFLHIGPYKTGSTSLQQTLYANRTQLSAQDILYPDRFIRTSAHFGLSDGFKWGALNAEHLRGFGKQLATCREGTIVLSNEALSAKTTLMPCYRKLRILWQALASELDAFNLKIVFYVRRPDDSTESRYLQTLKGGNRYSDFRLKEVLYDGSAVDVFHLASSLRDAFPRAELIPRPFDRTSLVGGDVVSDFLDLIGARGLEIAEDQTNVTPSGKYLRMMQIANHPRFKGLLSENVKQKAWQSFGPSECKATVLNHAQRARIMDFFEDSFRDFVEEFVPAPNQDAFLQLYRKDPNPAEPNLHLEIMELVPFLTRTEQSVTKT